MESQGNHLASEEVVSSEAVDAKCGFGNRLLTAGQAWERGKGNGGKKSKHPDPGLGRKKLFAG